MKSDGGTGKRRPKTKHPGFGIAKRTDGVTRRKFLRNTAIVTAGAIVGPKFYVPGWAQTRAKSKIVRAFHPDATTGWSQVNQEPVTIMVHAAVCELTGIDNTADAWKSLFPGMTTASKVAIKINLACGDVPTHPEMVNAIIDGLLMIDLEGGPLPEENIIVHDMDNAFFCAQTGYVQNWGGPGVQYVGTDHPSLGWDNAYVFPISHPHGSITNHKPSKIITQHCDYFINAAVIKDHSDSDVTLCLKNHYGSFSNVPISQLHQHGYYGDGHTRGEPEFNRLLRDELGDKTKLWLIDGTYGLFDGGPGYVPPYHTPPNWAYNSVIVGFDPVAIDRIGTEKINEERIKHKDDPIPPSPLILDPSHVTAAAGAPYDLGTDDPGNIDLVEFDASATTGVDDFRPGPGREPLLTTYPNPTRAVSNVRFSCPRDGDVEMVVVDVRGRLVRRIAQGRYSRGMHHLQWDGRDEGGRAVASGIYFCRADIAGRRRQRRIVVLR
ncbi:MAG: DUF362 domain-containing protein [Candidatus Eisenbacteria sp.]|nr:DUF362 domain-containing protein [Candidatus Eisenbacteria bacterium]